ncbi:hypothetical protein Tco_1141912, partial [Tanacetum coccineum]
INLPLGDPLDTLSMKDREIDFNPSRDIDELERLLADDPIPVPRVFDNRLGNFDLMSRSSETSDLFEELIVEIGLDDSIPIGINDKYYNLEGDILFFVQLLNEDTCSKEDEGDRDIFFWFSSYAITSSCCILTEGGDVSLLPSSPHTG